MQQLRPQSCSDVLSCATTDKAWILYSAPSYSGNGNVLSLLMSTRIYLLSKAEHHHLGRLPTEVWSFSLHWGSSVFYGFILLLGCVIF